MRSNPCFSSADAQFSVRPAPGSPIQVIRRAITFAPSAGAPLIFERLRWPHLIVERHGLSFERYVTAQPASLESEIAARTVPSGAI